MRVKRGVVRHRRHLKVRTQAKGFYGQRKNVFKRAKEALLKAGNLAFRDRRVKKRVFRSDWIRTINTACRQQELKYSDFISGLKKAQIVLDRKTLASLAKTDPLSFQKIVEKVKKA